MIAPPVKSCPRTTPLGTTLCGNTVFILFNMRPLWKHLFWHPKTNKRLLDHKKKKENQTLFLLNSIQRQSRRLIHPRQAAFSEKWNIFKPRLRVHHSMHDVHFYIPWKYAIGRPFKARRSWAGRTLNFSRCRCFSFPRVSDRRWTRGPVASAVIEKRGLGWIDMDTRRCEWKTLQLERRICLYPWKGGVGGGFGCTRFFRWFIFCIIKLVQAL